jgi:hypothetical protein
MRRSLMPQIRLGILIHGDCRPLLLNDISGKVLKIGLDKS